MRYLSATIATASLLAGFALAAHAGGAPTTTTICLDPAGRILPATCRAWASRLDRSEHICQCLSGGDQITIPVCPAGVEPPAESAAYFKARREAVRNGSLVGATYEGKPMCLTARNRAAGRY